MPENATKDALEKALAFLGGTGGLAAIGVFVRGFFSGTTGQEKEVRDSLTERNEKLQKLLDEREAKLESLRAHRDEWRQACYQARIEAERLGYDRSKWGDDPKEDS